MATYGRSGPLRTLVRVLFGALLLVSFAIFILWRTENPRLLRLRHAILDAVAPALTSVAGPSNALTDMLHGIESFSDLQAENTRLRLQVQRLRAWRDIAQRLEEENGRLRALNAVKPPLRVSFVTAEIIGDAGGPFAQSVVVNVGGRDDVIDGSPALGASGLVGRVVGAGEATARILLLTDPTSRTPVLVGAQQRRAILHGDNSIEPLLQHVAAETQPEIGDVVVTSGHGGVYPQGLHIGRVASAADGQFRVRLAESPERIEFLRIYRRDGADADAPPGGLIIRAPREEPAEEPGVREEAQQDARETVDGG